MKLGKTDIDIKPIGLGSWAIGGQFFDLGAPAGWGDVDDNKSLAALDLGISMGVTLIDTANIYGAGHSEVLVGKAVKGRRDKITIISKFGNICDETSKQVTGIIQSPADIIQSCEDSLKRLNTDYIDIYLFHLGEYDMEKAPQVKDTLEKLVKSGKIRYFGWSTSDPKRAAIFADSKNCIAIEFAQNVIEDDASMVNFCKEHDLTAICRSPLAMGLLTGKYNKNTVLPNNDLRGKNAPPWMTYYIDGKPNEMMLQKLKAIREILTSDGRTLAQGCISWIWGCGNNCIPIPGFKSPEQVQQNVSALEYGPLNSSQMNDIRQILTMM